MDELIKQLLVRNHDLEFVDSTDDKCGNKRVIIFALGENARDYFHSSSINGSIGIASSVLAMFNSSKTVDILFLEKLQYLFMYLTKFEADTLEQIDYNHIVIFGLESLLSAKLLEGRKKDNSKEKEEEEEEEEKEGEQDIIKGNANSVEVIKSCNLIMNIAHKTKLKHGLKLDILECSNTSVVKTPYEIEILKEIHAISSYWRKLLN